MPRGLAHGDTRTIRGVHLASDVEAGPGVGAALFAALKTDPVSRRTSVRRLKRVRERRLSR